MIWPGCQLSSRSSPPGPRISVWRFFFNTPAGRLNGRLSQFIIFEKSQLKHWIVKNNPQRTTINKTIQRHLRCGHLHQGLSSSLLSRLSSSLSSRLSSSLVFSSLSSPLLSLSPSFHVSVCCWCCVSCVSCWGVKRCKTPLCVDFKKPPCVPAPRAHVFQHVRVVPAYTVTSWTDTRGRFLTPHTGLLNGRHNTTTTHTTTPQLTKISPRKVITCFRGSPN